MPDSPVSEQGACTNSFDTGLVLFTCPACGGRFQGGFLPGAIALCPENQWWSKLASPFFSWLAAGMKPRFNPSGHDYWSQVKRITWRLLAVWIGLILSVVLLIPLFGITVYGVPLTYWVISSFLLLSFLGLVACYALRMDRLESKFKRAVENNRNPSGDTDEKQHRRGGPPPF
ncbi:MAG TPA: sodium/substrate symporter small subunit [Limnobacter sp.]|nr:sodium/substrate symporter small subunit [Limnobacter sp.]